MQHTQQLFLEALKAALKNEQVEWNNKLEAQEWMDLFRMAEVHQILPMIYEAVYRSPAAGQADPQILAPAKAQMRAQAMVLASGGVKGRRTPIVRTVYFLSLASFLRIMTPCW